MYELNHVGTDTEHTAEGTIQTASPNSIGESGNDTHRHVENALAARSSHAEEDRSGSVGYIPCTDWPIARKWRAIVLLCFICFAVGINATAILTASDQIMLEFNIDESRFPYSFFLATAWNAAAALIPVVILPLVEDFGLRRIYVGIYSIFVVFVVPQAVAKNFATLVGTRIVTGGCGGVLQNVVDGAAADIWGDDVHSRALSLTIFIFSLLGGVTIGPVIGGGILATLHWRW
jgi:MFS family permease